MELVVNKEEYEELQSFIKESNKVLMCYSYYENDEDGNSSDDIPNNPASDYIYQYSINYMDDYFEREGIVVDEAIEVIIENGIVKALWYEDEADKHHETIIVFPKFVIMTDGIFVDDKKL